MIRGGLFTRFFLEDGIRNLPEYAGLDAAAVSAFASQVQRHWHALAMMRRPSEPETESEFTNPVAGLVSAVPVFQAADFGAQKDVGGRA